MKLVRKQARREDGAMLIIALGVLTLMAILGAAFATLVRLEKKATENYIDGKRMDFLLDSALDRAIADLQAATNFRHYTFYDPKGKSSPWLNLIRTRTGQLEGDLANGRVDIDDPSNRLGTWEVFTERAGQTYRFKSKIIDCAAQINLNGRQDTLARMLTNLGKAIESSERLKRDGKTNIRNPLWTRPNGQGNQVTGAQIVQLRQRLPGGVFGSKSELKLIIGPENFDVLKDFVTVHSWEDPDTYKPTDGLNEVPDLTGIGSTGTASASRGVGGSGAQRQPAAYGVPRLDAEPRHPININTAPEEVLIAVLQGLAGRRVFPYSKLGIGGSIGDLDQGAQITGDRIPSGKEELRDVTPRAVFAYTQELTYDNAKKLADRIVSQRKQRPFMAWRTNDANQPGFEDFIDGLDSSFFPSPQSCQIVDPDMSQRRDAESAIKNNAGTEMGRLWVKGHGLGAVKSTRQSLGLGFHEQYAWYYDLAKGVIKSNANPNSRINRYNPNGPAYIPVDKSDLVWLQRNRVNLYKGYTTEFCFDTGGSYEVTTYAQIAQRDKTGEPTTFAPGQRGLEAVKRITLERKMRSVVKVYETLRHTNQFQFARTFNAGPRSSANDRKYVVTWPDPLAALTEVWSTGSLRDGRVELAGLLDGRRLELPVFQRTQNMRNYPALIMAHTFQDRDNQSIANLVRIVGQGIQSRQGDVVAQALGEVYDAAYSAQKSTNRKHLRRQEVVALGGGTVSQEAIHSDPLVDREVLGTDLFPDGINTSLLRMSHLGTRSLVLPARSKVGDTSSGGEGSPLVGASGRSSRGNNRLGNVPYYRGGIAFYCKLEFDGDDPVFCGLMGCTQVIKEVSPAATDFTGSEGTQFFIFKNSRGQLRIVRMYYHQAFLNQQGEGGSGSTGGAGEGIKLFPDPGGADAGGAAGGGTGQNPIVQELDPKKVISRSDILVDVTHFKAHEWHHIAVEWDDENQNYPRLYLDFQPMELPTYHAQDPSTLAPPPQSWVRLNERQPRDGLFVGSIIRDQGLSDGGIFKWFTNTAPVAGGGGVQTVAQQTKRILANATIDELITFENNFLGMKQYYGAQGSPGYFTTQPGEYANLFEIPAPPDVDSVTLRSFDWTSYYPTTYADSKPGSIPQRLQVTPMQCEVYYPSQSAALPPLFTEPWRRPQVANEVAGRQVFRQSTGLKGASLPFVYKFRMSGARSALGNSAGGVVQTPVIDDVTLTYFLPNPKILIQEEAE